MPRMGHFFLSAMQFYKLSPAFYAKYKDCTEILIKQQRPYYVLLLEINTVRYAIPLRSHIKHADAFIADGKESGLDFSKAVIITDENDILPAPVTIRQNEFHFLKQHENVIKLRFSAYVARYKKQIIHHIKNQQSPLPLFCTYSTLQYFHQELGLPARIL
jgi:protein AbiQ